MTLAGPGSPVRPATVVIPEDYQVPPPTSQQSHPFAEAVWRLTNGLLVISLLVTVYGALWEYSTQRYLRGFVDAIVPQEGETLEKVEALLVWMRAGPPRSSEPTYGGIDDRNPTTTLNHRDLLAVCGTATNAFVNLAVTAGIPARRLLLLDETDNTRHVTAEILLDGHWFIVDPTTRTLFRRQSGALVTKQDLTDSRVFASVIGRIDEYDPAWTFDRTTYLRLERVPILGSAMRRFLDTADPNWEERINWTLLLERPSFLMLVLGIGALLTCMLIVTLLRWFLFRRFGMCKPSLIARGAPVASALLGLRA